MFFGKYFCFYFIIKLEIINIYMDIYHKARDPGVQQCLISLQGLDTPVDRSGQRCPRSPRYQEPPSPIHGRITALKVKGPKTLKPPPTLPKPCLPLSCRENSLKSTKGVGDLLLGTLLPAITRAGPSLSSFFISGGE